MKNRRTSVTSHRTNAGPGSPWVTIYGLDDSALLLSENHIPVKGVYRSGGPFVVRHRKVKPFVLPPLNWQYGQGQTNTPFLGTYFTTPNPQATSAQLEQQRIVQSSDAWSYGATGWKRARPGNPIVSVATSVGELKDFLPSLPFKLYSALTHLIARKQAHKRLHGAKGLADAHLSIQFGWIPLLSDIRAMYEAQVKIDKRLAIIMKQNGRGVRKRRDLKNVHESTRTVASGANPFYGWNNPPANVVSGSGSVETVTTTIERVWFVGKFRYYIPEMGSSQWTWEARNALWGNYVTPEVVWNLLPWSWLIDWFGNIGDVMSNMSANAIDDVTADYAYVMRTVTQRTEWFGTARWSGLNDPYLGFIAAGSARGYAVDETTWKVRSAGSPFGFGATFDGLSSRQLSIAAALGISRWA